MEIMLKNKCCLYVIISIRFFSITICNLLIEFPSYIQKYTYQLRFITIPGDFQSQKPYDWAFQSRHLATASTACQVASSDSGASRVNYWYTKKISFLACFSRTLRLQTTDAIRKLPTHRRELQRRTQCSPNLV